MALSSLTKKLFPHAGNWVAMTLDRKKVLVSGSTIENLHNELKRIGVKKKECDNIVITKLPPLGLTISPWVKY